MAILSGTRRIRAAIFERGAGTVNCKVHGSNPWSGANLAFSVGPFILRSRHQRTPYIVDRRDACRATQEGFELLLGARFMTEVVLSPPRPTTDVILAQLTTQMACSWSLHGLVRKVVVGAVARCPNSASESVSITQDRHFSSDQP